MMPKDAVQEFIKPAEHPMVAADPMLHQVKLVTIKTVFRNLYM
jgi:hypothetical protein